MLPSLLVALGIVAYCLMFVVCASGSCVAGILARRLSRQMLVATDAAAFQDLENKFNQASVACLGLAMFAVIQLAFVPAIARGLVWP